MQCLKCSAEKVVPVIAQFGRCANCNAIHSFTMWNGDMIIHTVISPQAVKAVEAVEAGESPTPQELFEAGAEARRERSDEPREYDLVLYGLGAVLRTTDLEPHGWTWEDELNRRFHYPLANSGMLEKGVDGIVAKMSAAIERSAGRSPGYKIERVLRGERDWIFTAGARDLETRVVKMEKSLAGGGSQQVSIGRCRGYGQVLLRQIEIIEALGGDTSDLGDVQEQAQAAIKAADRMEAQCRQRLEQLKNRLENLPIKRAQALRLLSELKTSVTQGWGTTATAPGADLICDGATILRADALYAGRRCDLYERTGEREMNAQDVQAYWDQALSVTDTIAVDILGWRDNWLSREEDEVLGYAITDDGDLHFFSPHRAVCIAKWTMTSCGPLEIKINRETGRFLFYRGGNLVALLTAVHVGADLPLRGIDIATAREVLMTKDKPFFVGK